MALLEKISFGDHDTFLALSLVLAQERFVVGCAPT